LPGHPLTIPSNSPLSEPLAFPLMFPKATLGWEPELKKGSNRNPKYIQRKARAQSDPATVNAVEDVAELVWSSNNIT
jgi:hypothetical protein